PRRPAAPEESPMAAFTHFHSTSGGNDDDARKARSAMRQMMGPGQVDQAVRMAIQQCWMLMPDDRKHVDAVEAEIRRLVNRALEDLREDVRAFGITEDGA